MQINLQSCAGLACLLTGMLISSADDKSLPGKDLRINSLPANKVLFLGNSITIHGPLESIGWSGNWGMAASEAGKDFVHLLLAKLSAQTHGQPEVLVRNIADFERQYSTLNVEHALSEPIAFEADIVILAIGENVTALTTVEEQMAYQAAVVRLLKALRSSGASRIFVRSTFWTDARKDAAMQKACHETGAIFVDLGKLDADESNFARAERRIDHAGVASHPGDKGMQLIAEGLWKAILDNSQGQ